ncbi:MAG: hypothetical protein IPL59_26760 [Candidatus Competibacteraceae bacterium]|nr:hypothetical protein [Candidatus Competibacteraceae bacterium]
MLTATFVAVPPSTDVMLVSAERPPLGSLSASVVVLDGCQCPVIIPADCGD